MQSKLSLTKECGDGSNNHNQRGRGHGQGRGRGRGRGRGFNTSGYDEKKQDGHNIRGRGKGNFQRLRSNVTTVISLGTIVSAIIAINLVTIQRNAKAKEILKRRLILLRR